jgi:histidine triad (HIT) family protein
MSSIFTRIIKKEIPAYIIYENEKTIAFLDISQATRGHTLVVPKEEAATIFELSEESLIDVIKVTKRVANNIKERLHVKGVNILSNNGVIAGQSVNHFHIHIIPRYVGDNVSINLSNNASTTGASSMEVLRLLLKDDK